MKSRKISYIKFLSLFFAIAVLVFIAGCIGTPPAVPIINSFLANPLIITVGESSALSWSVTDATSVTINNGIGSVALTGTTAVNPITTTTYTLTATNSTGSVTASATVTVIPLDTNQLASIQIKVMNYEWWYDVYMDGNQFTGIWLGTTNWKGEATFNDISTGYHSFYVISVDIMYDGYKEQTIYPGNNTVEIDAYSMML